MRDEVVDYIRYWSDKTGIKATKMIRWIGIHRSKYYDWASRDAKLAVAREARKAKRRAS